MIPYFTIEPFELLGLEIRPFFVLVTLGVIAGILFYDRINKPKGLVDRKVALHLPEICVLGGFIGAHLFHVIFYVPEELLKDPLLLFKIWGGYSSVGGFFGGMTAGIVYLKIHKASIIAYGDRALFGLTLGWIFGRMGCSIAHDHPGKLSDFPLAVQFPGGARHDLGLYELWVTLLIFGVLLYLARRPRYSGTFMAAILLIYSPVRFLLDFLRSNDLATSDPRYFGLTVAQYVMIVLFAVGLWLVITLKNRPIDAAFLGRKKRAKAVQSG